MILRVRKADDPAVPIGPAWLVEAGRDITGLGSVTIIVLLIAAVVGYLWLDRRLATRGFVILATFGGFALAPPLKALFRPPARSWCPT